jgi:hypothetical protein
MKVTYKCRGRSCPKELMSVVKPQGDQIKPKKGRSCPKELMSVVKPQGDQIKPKKR